MAMAISMKILSQRPIPGNYECVHVCVVVMSMIMYVYVQRYDGVCVQSNLLANIEGADVAPCNSNGSGTGSCDGLDCVDQFGEVKQLDKIDMDNDGYVLCVLLNSVCMYALQLSIVLYVGACAWSHR